MSDLKYQKRTIRSSAILTGSYVAATVVGPQGNVAGMSPVENNQLVVLLTFTLGSLTSAEMRVRFSDDNSTFYQETAASVSGGTSTLTLLEHTFTATGNYRIPIPLVDRYVEISVKGTGTVTSSLMTVDAVIAVRP